MPSDIRSAPMSVETALLFCAIRANEMFDTLSFTRDPRAGYEIALCMKRDGGLSTLCLTSPALVLHATLHPARFGSVASCFTYAFEKAPLKIRNKDQGRLQASDE
jgi:hypothetical protein